MIDRRQFFKGLLKYGVQFCVAVYGLSFTRDALARGGILPIVGGTSVAAGGDALSVVQHTWVVGSVNTAVLSVSATTAGNLLVVATTCRDNTITVSGITDNAGSPGTYVQATNARATHTGSPRASDVWYCLSAPSGATTITVTFSADSAERSAWVWEVSGFVSPVFDTANSLNNGNGSGTTLTGAEVTTADTKGFVVGVVKTANAVVTNPAAENEFVDGSDSMISTNGDAGCALISSTAASHTPVWTDSTSNSSYCASTAAFKE